MRTLKNMSPLYDIGTNAPPLANWGKSSSLFNGPLNGTNFLTF